MTDLFAYHVAKQQLTEARRTAGETRLTSTSNNHRALTSSRRLIAGLLRSASTARTVRQRLPKRRIPHEGH
jgi:hypothetical protein